jgi:hypothetical protein
MFVYVCTCDNIIFGVYTSKEKAIKDFNEWLLGDYDNCFEKKYVEKFLKDGKNICEEIVPEVFAILEKKEVCKEVM